MTKQLILNEKIEQFLDTENEKVWNLILEDKIDELLTLLPLEDETLSRILEELFTNGVSETLNSYEFVPIKEGDSILFRNLVRLIFSLNINGKRETACKSIEDRLFEVLPPFVERIQNEVMGGPMRRVSEAVVMEAAAIRASLISLIYFYRETEDIDALHFVAMMRTKLTLAIMGNHKHILGYDMIEVARIKEQLGDKEAALGFYTATRDNLDGELHWFKESPEMGPNEDDVIMLQSLKEAFLSIDRLRNISESEKVCALIDEILTREYIDVFEGFDDEDDDE